MNIHIDKKLAQQIVSTVRDVCGQNVNFIDCSGVIYASTDESRIGSFHEIGRQAAATGMAQVRSPPGASGGEMCIRDRTYTPQSAQAELNRVFAMQYTLTLTEETEIRYRTETSTDPETGETTTEEVPYEYHILNVKLTNKPISEIAEELLTPQQLEMYRVYLETSGNKPLIFGGGSPDMGASEDLSGVQLVNGTRPGNTAVVDLAKRQVGNVGGRPFWSWYGFNSRVEWCACFVSW